MARLRRLVIPGIPYHVTQRGNRRQQTFFEDSDFALYRDLLGEAARRAGAAVWSYCLMPNHVHVIVVPGDADSLRRTFADAHRRYTGFINARHRWTGHLWQGRFGAVAMDESHLAAAVRYVALNPVRARLVERADQWQWSSARAHLSGRDDELVEVLPVLERYGILGRSLEVPKTSRRRGRCAWPRRPDARSAARSGYASWSKGAADRWRRGSAVRSRGQVAMRFRVFSKLSP